MVGKHTEFLMMQKCKYSAHCLYGYQQNTSEKQLVKENMREELHNY